MLNYWRQLLFALFVLIFPLYTHCQTGPMGIGNGTGAGSQPRLLLWLDGSSAVGNTNGAIVTSWNDKSGNNNHFTSLPGITYNPEFRATEGPSNTPALQFRERDDQLVCPNFELPGNGYSIYFVIRSGDDNYALFDYSTFSSPTVNRQVLIYNDNGIRQQLVNPGDTITRNSAIGDISDNNWDYGGILLSTANGDNWEYSRDQTDESGYNNFFGKSFASSGSAVIGGIRQNEAGSIATDYFTGFIAEIIIYEGRLPRPATRLLRTYFWVKYGLNGAGNAWDKFHYNMQDGSGAQWGAKFYAPIGIGNATGINSGRINEARSEGLVLRVKPGPPSEYTQSQTYICAGPLGSTAAGVPDNEVIPVPSLPGVVGRWSRLWEIDAGTDGPSQIYEIAFDFGEGINGGENPQNVENFRLLHSASPTGPFSVLPVISTDPVDDEVVFRVSLSTIRANGPYYTIGTTDNAASSLTGTTKRTWYAYQSGDWSDPLTWTLDGSAAPAYVNSNNSIPAIYDDVYIGSGRNVIVDLALPQLGDLRVFGTLDFASAPQSLFSSIGGSGLIRCSAGNFPTGNSAAFADASSGGTLEFYGAGGFTQTANLLVNKLKVKLNTPTSEMTFSAGLTTNGLFEINRGEVIINHSSNIEITSNDHVLIETTGRIYVGGSGSRKHKWNFYGDLINSGGEIKFTTRTVANISAYSDPETQPIIEAFFISPSVNQKLIANGLSNFSRIVTDKGVDMTYTLSISSTNPLFFKLLGPCDFSMSNAAYTAANGNQNSFALVNGTAEIRDNIFIPLHTNVGNYNINNTAQLWVNGGEVTKGRLGGSGNSGGLVPYGTLKISDGILNSLCYYGLTLRDNGLIQVDGGVVNTNVIRTSDLGVGNVGGLIINDGEVNVDGSRPEGAREWTYTVSLTYPGNLFRMSGGVLNVTGPTPSGLIFINSDPQNTSVTGGTVHLDVSNNEYEHKISSRAAFWNLTLTKSLPSPTINFKVAAGDSGPDNNDSDPSIDIEDLVVKNNLSIIGLNNTKLAMGIPGDPSDLYLDGNLTIESGCEYIHNNNNTHFVGSSNSSLSFGGSTAFPFHNVIVDKDLDSRFATIQQTGPTVAMDILGSLNLEKGYFVNNNREVYVRGNVTNRTQFGEGTSTWLRMIGTSGRQEIISDGGIFYRLVIQNPDGVELKNDGVTVKNQLYFSTGSFFIGDNKLRMETTHATPIESSNETNEFVVCSGNASAGGLEILNHSASQSLFYPIGVSTGSVPKYARADIYVNSGWTDDGFIRVTPVDTLLSTADLSGTGDYLNFYWKVSSSDYNIQPNVTHVFRYQEADIRPLEDPLADPPVTAGTDALFESGRVLSDLPFTRNTDAPSSGVDIGLNRIYYNGPLEGRITNGPIGTPLVNANYSAGAADRFPNGTTPEIFFSNSTTVEAAWEIPGNWNICPSCTDPYVYHSTSATIASDYPKAGDIAVIGFNVNSGGKPHVYKGPPGGIEAIQVVFTPLQDTNGNRQPRYSATGDANFGILRPTLQILETEDIIKVAQISGEGALWIEGDIDLGVTDLGGFLAEDSSVVVLRRGTVLAAVTSNFLPPIVPNLFIASTSPFASTIATDIRIRGNLEVGGAAQLWLSENLTGSIEIDGDLILDKYQLVSGVSPRVLFNPKGSAKTIHVHGDTKLRGTVAYIGVRENIPTGPQIPWTPAEINAQVWLDATTGVTTSGGLVTSWVDQATGYVATQTNSGKSPSYQIGMNGLHTLRFDGVNDFLAIPHTNDLNILANQDFEIFSVTQFDEFLTASASDFGTIYGKGTFGNRFFLLYVAENKYRLQLDGNQFQVISPNNHTNADNLGWARRQSQTGELFNTVGGTVTVSGVANAKMDGNTRNVTIGAASRNSTGDERFMEGDIAEIVLIRRTLTNEERKRMEGYLAHKWGLENELPAGHPYKNNSPIIGDGITNSPGQLIVDGDIIQNLTSTTPVNNGIKLYNTDSGIAFANLIVTTAGNNVFNNISGPAPRLWKLRVDKGIDITSSFSFNTNVEIDGPATEPEKPVEIRNGLVKFNNANIDVTLTSGGGDFIIPSSGGLELNNGDLSITGTETGLLLSGSLNITGGSFTIGDTEGVNNYIEYGGGGSPKINIAGGTLLVGSQIRRNLTSTAGALDYQQSGGDVILGRYSAPQSNRGVLEVVNAGSRFIHTGGNLTFVRGVTLGSTPSLLLAPEDPTMSNVSGTSEINIGNGDSPSGGAIKNFGIQSNISLNDITINSINSPVANLISNNLELNGDLTIEQNATLNCGALDLILHGDVSVGNNGLLKSVLGTVSLMHPISGTVSGSGNFDLYDLERTGNSGTTFVETSLLIKHAFANDGGEMNFDVPGADTNTLEVKGNVTTDGILSFDPASEGLIFSGTSEQILTRTTSTGRSEIDVLSINNSFGVTIPAGFFKFLINENLRLQNGVFALTGNLLEMASGSVFTPVNAFGETNMIVSGGAFANFGVLMHVPANSTDDIFVPLGIDRYMPINLDFGQTIDHSSGDQPSTYLLRLNIPENGVVVQDIENPLDDPQCDTQINDLNNVLGMFFSVDGSNIGDGLNVDLNFRYDQQYVQVTSPYTEAADYIGARVLADDATINKFGTGAVDAPNNILTFNIQGDFASELPGFGTAVDGDYFAGLNCAIPNTIPIYTTASNGDVDFGLVRYLPDQVPGGGAPSGAIVIVQSGHTLIFPDHLNGVNFYRTIIESGAQITIDESNQHRLGRVSGSGTIRSNGSGILPAGDYADFFGCGRGKLIFASAGKTFEVLSNMPPIEEVTLRGPGGQIKIADSEVTICNNLILSSFAFIDASNTAMLTVGGNLEIQSGELNFRQGNTIVQGNLVASGTAANGGKLISGNNGNVTVEGDLIIGGKGIGLGTVFRETHVRGNVEKTTSPTGGSIQNGTAGAKLVFDGNVPQIIYGIDGDFTGFSGIPSIELNNAMGLTVTNGDIDISESLFLSNGNIFTSAGNLLRLTQNATEVNPIGGQPNSFVDGPIQWTLAANAAERKFPVGKNDRYRPLSISNRNAARTWEVEYNDESAQTVPSIDPFMLPDPFNVPAIETVSVQEFWRVNSNTTLATAANIRLSWGDSSAVSTNTSDQSELLVLAYNEGTDVWDSYGGDGFQYNAATNRGSLISVDPVSFSERYLTLGSSDNLNPLPVTWLYFTGENKEADNILSWATASEKNNDYFELERSFDADSWTSIAQITAAGFSTTKQMYSYTDQNAPVGRVYYRLKQVDFDDQGDYAPNVVSLERGFTKETEVLDFLLYPNPTGIETVRFRMSNVSDVRTHVSIYDLSGQLLSQDYVQVDGQGTSAPIVCDFEPGIYLVTIIVNDKMRSKPLVITR